MLAAPALTRTTSQPTAAAIALRVLRRLARKVLLSPSMWIILAIAAVVSEKFLLAPAGNIGRRPGVRRGFRAILSSFMMQILQGKQFALFHRLVGLPDEHAVHDYLGANRQLGGGELVLCGNARNQLVGVSVELDRFTFAEVGQSDENVIARIELKDFLHSG